MSEQYQGQLNLILGTYTEVLDVPDKIEDETAIVQLIN
jgi:hypothetical protein